MGLLCLLSLLSLCTIEECDSLRHQYIPGMAFISHRREQPIIRQRALEKPGLLADQCR
jgi:hypothetical protein